MKPTWRDLESSLVTPRELVSLWKASQRHLASEVECCLLSFVLNNERSGGLEVNLCIIRSALG